MPIVKLQLIRHSAAERVSREVLQTLADKLGSYFESDPGGTWVMLDYLPAGSYAENHVALDEATRPTIVTLLQYQLPATEQLAREADAIAEIVATSLNRPKANTHVIFSPEGKNRIAFGGTLVT